jgi:hypothetical protein
MIVINGIHVFTGYIVIILCYKHYLTFIFNLNYKFIEFSQLNDINQNKTKNNVYARKSNQIISIIKFELEFNY